MAIAIPHALSKHFSWESPDKSKQGTFRANPGKPVFAYKAGEQRFAVRNNPIDWESGKEPTYSANLFVGFSVKNKPVWTMNDLVKLVKEVRRRQVKHPDSSFIYQRGVYTHLKKEKGDKQYVVTEDGAQVILLNVVPMKKNFALFRKHVIRLAEIICERLEQDTVIVRIDKNGIAEETIGVIA